MLSKDIMLKHTEIELDYVRDIDMIHFFKNSIRGGLSFIGQRYMNTKQKTQERKKSNLENPEVTSLLLDINNLYGDSMSNPLPTEGYKWLTKNEIHNLDISKYNKNSKFGYVLEVDLEYPEHLHLAHNSFPMATEHRIITENDLSEYSNDCMNKLYNKQKFNEKKLVSTFLKKEKYICHIRNLQYYLENGLILKNIYRVVKFEQKPFLKNFIDYCTKKRKESKTKTQSDIYKLIANSIYGKFIESSGNRVNVKFITNEKAARKSHTDPRFKSEIICSEKLSIVFMSQATQNMRRSWAIGFTILELSKLKLTSLYYDHIVKAFDNEVTVLMSDTDSVLCTVPAKNSDKALKKIKDIMDFGNYHPSHKLYDTSRKNEVGFLKNETPGEEITEFAGLKSKSYAYLLENDTHHSKLKGIKKPIKKTIGFKSLLKCLNNVSNFNVSQYSIESKKHQINLVKKDKIGFNSFDCKRYYLCNIHSVPYGSIIITHFLNTNRCIFCDNKEVLI